MDNTTLIEQILALKFLEVEAIDFDFWNKNTR